MRKRVSRNYALFDMMPVENSYIEEHNGLKSFYEEEFLFQSSQVGF